MLLFPHQSLGWLVALLYGLGIGAFIRAMSSNKMSGWKSAHREMQPLIRFLALILAALFAFLFLVLLFELLKLIVHPSRLRDPGAGALLLFAFCLFAGWLSVHLSLKKRKGS